MTISALKAKACELEGSDPATSKLHFGDVVLEDSQTVEHYKIDNGEAGPVLFLVRYDGGVAEAIKIHDPEPKGVQKEALEAIKQQQALAQGSK
jgi:hypothetical protein